MHLLKLMMWATRWKEMKTLQRAVIARSHAFVVIEVWMEKPDESIGMFQNFIADQSKL
jgi:hypothetical protein